jgi:hypothetical protein
MPKDPTKSPRLDWRKHLPVHPAAELFPLMSEAELKDLAEDIRTNGLQTPILSWSDDACSVMLLDGRNRLDALAQLGLLYETTDHHIGLKTWTAAKKWSELSGDRISLQHHHRHPNEPPGSNDPFALVLSLNVHRRHLTADQKRDLIAKLVKAKPDLSDRQIGKMAKASKNTAASVRANLEARGQVDHVEKRKDTKGRKQPAKKAKPAAPVDDVTQGIAQGTTGDACIMKMDAEAAEERDRAKCIALNQKVIAAEQQLAKHKAVSAKDTALNEFDGHVLRLLQMIDKAKPERFTKTGVSAANLMQLACFLNEVAAAARDGTAASADAMKAKLAALDTKSVHRCSIIPLTTIRNRCPSPICRARTIALSSSTRRPNSRQDRIGIRSTTIGR